MLPASSTLAGWAADEIRRHDWRMIVEAGHSIEHVPRDRWIGEVDVPTAIVCTTEDRGVSPVTTARDRRRHPRARPSTPIADGHLACANPRFVEPLLAACPDVADRAR